MAFTRTAAVLALVCFFGCVPSLALDFFQRGLNSRRYLAAVAPPTCPLGNGACPLGCPGSQGSDSGGCSASVSLKQGPSTINSIDGVTSDWGSLSSYKVSDLYNGFDANCNKDANGDLYMASVGACSGGALRICFVYRAKAAYTFTKSTNGEWVALQCDQSNKLPLLGKSYLADNSGYEACFSVSASATAALVSFLVHGEIAGTTSATPSKCCPMVFNIVCPTNLCANVSCPATACSTGTCDSSTGNCVYTNTPDGYTCSDGNACTRTDTCQGGICQGGNPVICSASDQCHVPGTCNTATGTCSNPVKTNGQSCDDGDACSQTDTCQAGFCVGSNPIVCTASDQCHVPGTCNSTTGTCSNPAAADGSTCNDQNACTQTDTCQSGDCTGSDPVVCTASDQCHVPGTCDTTTGTCSNPAAADGSTCDDQNACTQTDTCQSGDCTGSDPVICTASDQCHVPGTCDTTTGTCSNPAAPDGSTCNDQNACTQTDTCQSGDCTGSDPVVCTASDQCHVPGTCDTTTGTCSNPAQIDSFSCTGTGSCGAECFSGSCMNAKCDTAFWVPSIANCQNIMGSCSTTSTCCNWAQLNYKNWGFFKFVAPSTATTFLEGPLVAGAAKNDPAKGTTIGSFFYRFNGVNVEWYVASSRNVIFEDIHIWANFGARPSNNPGRWTTVLSSVWAQNSYGSAVSPKVTAVAGASSNQGMWLSAHASVGWF